MSIIFYDLETTGLNPGRKHKGIDIIEIGAVSEQTGDIFQKYLFPSSGYIPEESFMVHRIYIHESQMYLAEMILRTQTKINFWTMWI